MNGDDSTGGERASGYRHTPLEETKARRWYCNGERQQQRTVISRCVGKTMPYLPDPTETDRCICHATEESPGHVHIRELSAPKQSDCGRRCLPDGRCSIDYYYHYYCRKAKTEAVALALPRADSGQGSEGRLSIRAPYMRKHAETLQLSSNYVVRLQIGDEEGNERKRPTSRVVLKALCRPERSVVILSWHGMA